MQYVTETNYRLYLSKNLPEQSLSKKINPFSRFWYRYKEPNHRLIWTGIPCASKLVQLNDIQKMKIAFNNFILIFCSWNSKEWYMLKFKKTRITVKVGHVWRQPHHRGVISTLHVWIILKILNGINRK